MLPTSQALAQVSEPQLRDAAIAALAELHRLGPARKLFTYGEFVGRFLRLALPQLPGADLARLGKELAGYQAEIIHHPSGSITPEEHPDNAALLTVLWRLIGDGVVYPRLREQRDGYTACIEYVALTPRGQRVVAGNNDHPLRPGYIERLRARAPRMSDDVLMRLADAASCLEHGLLRASVVMVGLAVEETITEAHETLARRGTIATPRARMARDRLAEVEGAIAVWPNNDERHRLRLAIVSAENIRTERNRASHPGERFEDALLVEELLVSASRQLPVFSELIVP